MPQRLRLLDFRLSRLPGLLGRCRDDLAEIAEAVNTAELRLIYAKEAREEGWQGTWAEMVFNASASGPYLTTPRNVARIEMMTVCNHTVQIQNQFYQYLQFGNGTLPKCCGWNSHCAPLQSYAQNMAVTFVDLSTPPQLLRAYSDAIDVNKRALIQGTDNNNLVIYSQDNFNRVLGKFEAFQQPFTDWPMQFNTITGIQKDITNEPVRFYQVDPNTGAEVLLLTMEPTETTAWYRRYYLSPLSPHRGCQPATPDTIPIKAIVKLDHIPARSDTDYLLLQNKEAIINECESVRLSAIDTPSAKQMAQERHIQAIRMLVGELGHFVGINSPAVNFRPFGSASLDRVNISMT